MTEYKWSKSKNLYESPQKTIEKNKKQFDDQTDLNSHSILEHLEMMRMGLAIKGAYDLCEKLTKKIYHQNNITIIQGFQKNNQNVKSEFNKMYSDLQKQYESLKKEIGVNNVTDKTFSSFDSFEDFYDNFKDFTLFLENNPINDVSKLATYAHKHGDQLNNNLSFISLAVHLVHEHRHQHIHNEMPISLPCGHKLDPTMIETTKFCPTCGKPTKEKP